VIAGHTQVGSWDTTQDIGPEGHSRRGVQRQRRRHLDGRTGRGLFGQHPPLSGNDFGMTLPAGGFPANGNYGNPLLKLSTSAGPAVADYFEMDNEVSENGSDTDLGGAAGPGG